MQSQSIHYLKTLCPWRTIPSEKQSNLEFHLAMRKTFLKPTYFKSCTFGERPCGLNKRSKSFCRCSGITVYYLAPNLRELLHKTVWGWACLFSQRTRWCLGQPAAKMQFLQASDWLRFKREQIDQRWLTARPSGLPRNSGGKVCVKPVANGSHKRTFLLWHTEQGSAFLSDSWRANMHFYSMSAG